MLLLLAALLGLSAALIVLYPLLGLERTRSHGAAAGAPAYLAGLADLAERERAAKGALREVEFDYRLGNLEDADYQALRQRYEGRALAVLRFRYRREQALDALIERQLAELRSEETASTHKSATSNGTNGKVSPAKHADSTSAASQNGRNGAASSARPPAPCTRSPRARRRRRGGA
jgi:hypothetical protein